MSIYENKYLKYKKKYLDLKDMEAGAGFSFTMPVVKMPVLNMPIMNTKFFESTPEQLVIANRKKFQDAKLALNKANHNLEEAKIKLKDAEKANNRDKNNISSKNLSNAQNAVKLAEVEVTKSVKNIELSKAEYVKSKGVARELKLSNAQKAVEQAKNELKLAQDELNRFKKQEEERLAKKANKIKNKSTQLLIKDGKVDSDSETESLDEEPKIILPKKSSTWKCQENITLEDGYTCAIDGSWDCPNPVKHEDGFSCNGVRYTPNKNELRAYDYLFEKK